MAGTGRAPKEKSTRRNTASPQRGEWIELPNPPPLPKRGKPMPIRGKGRGKWSSRTRRAWTAWWTDPASTQWGPADVALLEHLADVFEEWVREPRSNMAGEVRQLSDSLGLTPKGKQDRRWRVPPPATKGQPAGVTALADYRKALNA